jgi:hypothetical protein
LILNFWCRKSCWHIISESLSSCTQTSHPVVAGLLSFIHTCAGAKEIHLFPLLLTNLLAPGAFICTWYYKCWKLDNV